MQMNEQTKKLLWDIFGALLGGLLLFKAIAQFFTGYVITRGGKPYFFADKDPILFWFSTILFAALGVIAIVLSACSLFGWFPQQINVINTYANRMNKRWTWFR